MMNDRVAVVFNSLLHAIEIFFERSECQNINLPEKMAEQLTSLVQKAGEFTVSKAQTHNTRLKSVLSQVSLNNHHSEQTYFLPLTTLALHEDVIYPQTNNGETLEADYQKLKTDFLAAWSVVTNHSINAAQIKTLLAIMECYLSQVPSANADISLFDHARISAAIAEGLYDFHADNLDSADFNDTETVKWRLICGDFSGIQNFIYKITSKGAAKGLRGRSFFMQLLSDAVSEQLIRKLGLTATARIYSSGGKFYLLIAANKLKALTREVKNINSVLLKQFRGEMYLGIGSAGITSQDLQAGDMGKQWQEANEDLLKNRQQPFVAQVTEDINYFMPEALHAAGACQVCDRDDANAGINEEEDDGVPFRICSQCKELREIGRVLTDTKYLLWAWGTSADRNALKKSMGCLRYIELCGTDCTLFFLAELPTFPKGVYLCDCHLESINDIETCTDINSMYSTGFRFAGHWQTEKKSGDFDFEQFAEQGKGIKRLGVLRMDVDNLGEVFIRGLADQACLARVATLSRQLHLFFAGYLSVLAKDFPLSQIIYAGGDDVFIIGSWHELPDVAKKIQTEFQRYCAHNPSFTLSSGIALATGKYPIAKIAEAAGDAESQAKQLKRGNIEKNALNFLNTTIGWESFDHAVQFKDKLIELTAKTNSYALIDRLRQVVIASNEIQAKLPTVTPDILYWNQWRWRLIYNLKRMAQRDASIEPDLKALQKQLLKPPEPNQQAVLDWLQLPVRWAEFLTRAEK